MNIAFDGTPLLSDKKTGVGYCEERIITNMLERYNTNGYDIDLFSFKKNDAKDNIIRHYESLGFNLNICEWFPGFLYRAISSFLPIPYHSMFNKDRDLTHFFNYYIPPGVKGVAITTIHDMAYKVYPETMRFKTKCLLNLNLIKSCNRADKIMTDSKFSKNEIVKYLDINPDKIFVAPLGVNTDFFYPIKDFEIIEVAKKKYGINDRYFLYLGTLEPRKNIIKLIVSYGRLVGLRKDAPLLILAGQKGWLYEDIFKKVKELNLDKKIIFTGYLDSGDINAIMNGAIAFLFPSLYEGFGMPPLEAMACGTPVVVSNAASLPEVVSDAGLYVDPYDVGDICDKMLKIIDDSDLRTDLSEEALKRAATFSWDKVVDLLINEYSGLLDVR